MNAQTPTQTAVYTAPEGKYHQIRRPSNFLVLSPAASSSAQSGVFREQEATSPTTQAAATEAPVDSAQQIEEPVKARRSSSVGSDSSIPPKFLKLGPVHFGGEPGVPDYSEAEAR